MQFDPTFPILPPMLHRRITLFLLLATLCRAEAPTPTPVPVDQYKDKIRLACVGDSITYGAGTKNPKTDSYPAQLSRLLGDKWLVQNFGVSGATMLRNGDKPWH